MAHSTDKSRRQFLRNTSLAALTATLLPTTTKATPAEEQPPVNCNPTTLDYYGQGPFYTANAPVLDNEMLAANDEPGTRLIISGIVRTLDCSQVIPNTLIDLWHANDAGQYDNEGYNLRGKIHSNEQGFYLFETILPGKYLNGSIYRPSHIHVKVRPPGFDTLTTQIYFAGDTDIPTDPAASIDSGEFDATDRTLALTENADGKLEGTWDIIVDGDGVTNVRDLHLERGMIYTAGPNPFTDTLTINYGIFQSARIRLEVYDLTGRQIALLDEQELPPAKYEAVWSPGRQLPAGHYWVALKVNDLQVHYLKVVKG